MIISAFDPFVPRDDAARTGVENCTLDALLASADVVSLHTPLTPERAA